MSLETSLSGISAAQTNIDTISNNIANVDTTGFKASRPEFVDLLGASLQQASGLQKRAGIGATVATLSQMFTEGDITNTGGPMDVAIDGAGFFQVKTPQGLAYSRNGALHVSKDGYLEDVSGNKLMGYTSGAGTGLGTPGPLQVSRANINPVATSKLGVAVNLPVSDSPVNTTTNPFSPSNGNSYDETNTTTVYDSLGQADTLTTYFTNVSGSGSAGNPDKWQTHYTLDDPSGNLLASGSGPTLQFNSAGSLVSGSGTIAVSGLSDGAAPLSITMDYTGSTLSNAAFGLSSVQNNGNGGGEYTGIQIGQSGDIVGTYSNGATKKFGKIALANFANLQGLSPELGTIWTQTSESGPPVLGVPGTGGLGTLQSQALESSNVNLSTELVNLISGQEFYQANAQAINTQQQNITRLLQIQ